MPELPEVHTTVTGLKEVLIGLTITDIWSDMWSESSLAKNTIKDRNYFPYFKKNTLNKKVIAIHRRAKYILIDLDNGFTIIVHLKMTGHLMFGNYIKNKKYNGREWSWLPLVTDHADRGTKSDEETRSQQTKDQMRTSQTKIHPLLDPYNRHIHIVFTLSNGSHLVYCDSRKFGGMSVMKTSLIHTERLSHLGPEPLETSFTLKSFEERIMKSPTRAIKTVLMDQTIISGIGNIYSDEMLHLSHIIPTRNPNSLSKKEINLLFLSMKKVLTKGIDFGGDSMSDYRNVKGERGAFQNKHLVYLRTKLPCKGKGCVGIIKKEKVGGRSAHYCPVCQK